MTQAQPALPGPFGALSPLTTAAADYDIVRRAIAHIRGNWRAQPEIDQIAAAVEMIKGSAGGSVFALTCTGRDFADTDFQIC